jgi:nicotinamidase/pyrazinamidase
MMFGEFSMHRDVCASQSSRLVFLDIDTQIDFMLPDGKLYLEESRHIFGNLHRLIEYALLNRILIVQTADTHTEDDSEFETYGFPPHCVARTPGWYRVPETSLVPDLVISQDPRACLQPTMHERVILIEKPSFSIASNPSALRLVELLRPCHFVAFGVATEGCVRSTVLSLLSLKFEVSVVIDAVAPGRVKAGEQTLEEFTSLGVRPLTTEDVCSGWLLGAGRLSGAMLQ